LKLTAESFTLAFTLVSYLSPAPPQEFAGLSIWGLRFRDFLVAELLFERAQRLGDEPGSWQARHPLQTPAQFGGWKIKASAKTYEGDITDITHGDFS
jgi:hypothetical protein